MNRTKQSSIFTGIISTLLFVTSLLISNLSYAYPKEGVGKASWYGGKHNYRRTASGEIFHESKFTAASNIIPIGKHVKMTCTTTGKSVVVKINDTGGFSKYGRTFDLSKAAFNAISDVNKGLTHVKYVVLD